MCIIHYWICVRCYHGSIRWTTVCNEMHPPLVQCPIGYLWDYAFCYEEQCFMWSYHPYAPPYLVGQGTYTHYVNGKPTGLSTYTRHASTQTESTDPDQPAQADEPTTGKMVSASTMTSQQDALVSAPMSRRVNGLNSEASSNASTQMKSTYQDSHAQTDCALVVMANVSAMTNPQDTCPPTATRPAAPDSPPMSPPSTPSLNANNTPVDYSSDGDTEYSTAKETQTDDEFTLVVGKRKKKKGTKKKKGKRGGKDGKATLAA